VFSDVLRPDGGLNYVNKQRAGRLQMPCPHELLQDILRRSGQKMNFEKEKRWQPGKHGDCGDRSWKI